MAIKWDVPVLVQSLVLMALVLTMCILLIMGQEVPAVLLSIISAAFGHIVGARTAAGVALSTANTIQLLATVQTSTMQATAQALDTVAGGSPGAVG